MRKVLSNLIITVAPLLINFIPLQAQAQTIEEALKLIDEQRVLIQQISERLKQLEQHEQIIPATDPLSKYPVVSIISVESNVIKDTEDGLEIVSPKTEKITFKPRGRVQVDALFSKSHAQGADYESGTAVRRARLGAQGTIGNNFNYVAEFEFAGKKVGFEDIYLQYNGFNNTVIKIGHQEAPVSLEDEISDTDMALMRRSTYNAFTLSRSVGLSVSKSGERWSFKTGIFGDPEKNSPDRGVDEGWRTSFRWAFVPYLKGTNLLHFGLSAYYVDQSSDVSSFRVAPKPGNNILNALIDTGSIDVDNIKFVGVETAFQKGSLAFQAEWGLQHGTGKEIDFTFSGGYAQLSWFLTGESRPYSVSSGKFGRAKPLKDLMDGGSGAIEIAARYSRMDLSSSAISGGKQDTWTVGASWYLNHNIRFMANIVHFNIKDSLETQPFGLKNHNGTAIAFRNQFVW